MFVPCRLFVRGMKKLPEEGAAAEDETEEAKEKIANEKVF
jgi:hypothetical protein